MRKNNFLLKNLMKAIIKLIIRLPSKINNFKRKKISFFEYKELSKELKNHTFQLCPGNNTYGTLINLKKYAKYSKCYNLSIEHGFYLGEYYDKLETQYPLLLTFSKNRKDKLNQQIEKINVETIGPYIHYAENLYEEYQINQMKKKLGKVLLVFPTHSTDKIDIQINEKNFLNKIEKIKKEYDTVLICLYYMDILRKKNKIYENLGYKVITAGHRNDIYFLNRLKTIILLSDYTISNFFGTHVIYCTHLNKPHTIFEEELRINGENKNYLNEIEKIYTQGESERKNITKYYTRYPNNNLNEIKRELNYLFGFNEVKNSDELKKILKKGC